MSGQTISISHGGEVAFENERPVAYQDFDFDEVDGRVEQMTPDQERMLSLETFDAERARRAAIRCTRKMGYGRRGIPHELVVQMFRDYQKLGSLSKAARIYKRSRQAMWDIFHSHELQMNERKFNVKIHYRGRTYTPMKGGYYRESGVRKDAQMLHYAMWEARTGRKVPQGWQVTFKNGDNSDFSSRNLVCLPIQEVSLLHYRRRFPKRGNMSAEQRREFWKEHYRKLAATRAAKFVAQGLRSDGKPRKKPKVIKLMKAA